MSSKDQYLTIEKPAEGSFRDRGSRFLAFAYPVASVDEIKSILTDLRKKYHDARHHCYAYRLGAGKQVYRVNDDGEPSNSAGKPILGQIRSMDLTNILVVVVRYFGGTLLGMGGLIQAYRSATADALEHARIVQQTENVIIRVTFPYDLTGDIMRILEKEKIEIVGQEYTDRCMIRGRIPKSDESRILARLNKLKGTKAGPDSKF
jgi:uncharacterized YigZ family protein